MRTNIEASSHASCTFPIGHNDPDAVHDQTCEVRNNDKPRLVAAFPSPIIASAVPDPTVMISGEHVADWLRSATR